MVSIESQSQVILIQLLEGQRLTASACRRYIFKVFPRLTNVVSNSGTIFRYGLEIASLKGEEVLGSTRMTNF